MRLILVRHGQTSSNVGGLLDTAVPGADLTGLGHQQANALIEALGGESVDRLVVSTLARTQQTAAPLAMSLGLTPEIRDGAREIAAGDVEMLGDEASLRTYMTTVVKWADGQLDVRMPGGEDGHEFFTRYNAVINELADCETAVVVSHGAAIRCWIGHTARNASADFIAHRPIANTGAAVLTGSRAAGWELLTWEGHALGGSEVDDATHAGPTGRGEPGYAWAEQQKGPL